MTITIDDYLPFYNGNLIFSAQSSSSSGDLNIWAALLEKTFAKIMGNYENINYGWQSESLRFLTGAPTYMIYTSSATSSAIWTEVDAAFKRGFNVGCDTSSSSSFGLPGSHAYHVLGTY
jgi:hypothetical protein